MPSEILAFEYQGMVIELVFLVEGCDQKSDIRVSILACLSFLRLELREIPDFDNILAVWYYMPRRYSCVLALIQ